MIKTKKLQKHYDDRGWLMECMRPDWKEFEKFGQAYITSAYPGVVKGWHYHKKQVDNFICIKGNIKLVITKDKKTFHEYYMNAKNPTMVQIPKNHWHGFRALGFETATIINIPSNTYNYLKPDETRVSWDSFDYDWGIGGLYGKVCKIIRKIIKR